MKSFFSILFGIQLSVMSFGVMSLAAQSPAPSAPLVAEPAAATFASGVLVRSEGVFSTDLIQGVPALPRSARPDHPRVAAPVCPQRR